MLSSPNKKFVLSRSFLNFLRTFCKLKGGVSSNLGKFCPTPGEFDHHFLPRGRELDKKICLGGRDSLAQKNFPGVAQLELTETCTQLELTETLQMLHASEPFCYTRVDPEFEKFLTSFLPL